MYIRLRLADILVRPMQRLTKYSLLLTAIRRHITDENDVEIMDAMVSDFDQLYSLEKYNPSTFTDSPFILQNIVTSILTPTTIQ